MCQQWRSVVRRWAVVAAVVAVFVAGCAPPVTEEAPMPTGTPVAEETPTPTRTPMPTGTPVTEETPMPTGTPATEPEPVGEATALTLSSSAFVQGQAIPVGYTCDGENVSPPLTWQGLPEGTESLALIADDPDAPGRTWVHWVIYNISNDTDGLPEDVPQEATLATGIRQGQNSGGDTGYAGPCPPSGTHRYFFKLYALDTELTNLPDRFDKEALLAAMDGHVLAQTELMGTYSRQ